MTYPTPSKIRSIAACLAAAALVLLATAQSARAADSVYWANYEPGSISYAGLAGGAGGLLDTTGAVVSRPNGLTIDSAAGRIYWISSEDKLFTRA